MRRMYRCLPVHSRDDWAAIPRVPDRLINLPVHAFAQRRTEEYGQISALAERSNPPSVFWRA